MAAVALTLAAAGPASAALPAPGAPTHLVATPGDGSVTLTWDASIGTVSGYQVWRRNSDGAWSLIASTASSTLTYRDGGLTNGVPYTYAVRAFNADAASPSSRVLVGIPVAPPAPEPLCGSGGSAYQRLISTTPGLAGYWRLGDRAGTSACEVTGRNNGTYTGGFTLGSTAGLAGDQDKAARFDGSTGYVRVPDSGSLALGDSFSVEAWVKRGSLNGTGNQVIASKQSGSWVLMFDDRNRLALRRSNVGGVAASTTVVADTTRWHHVAVTKAGGSVHLYIDGADVTGPVGNRTMTSERLLPGGD